MKYKIELIPHKFINQEQVDQIISLKMEHWNYDVAAQKKWIEENLIPDDYHLMVYDDLEQIIAYLNLVLVNVAYESFTNPFLGIGNVSVKKMYSGQGFGKLIMDFGSAFIKKMGFNGILLCKPTLNNFYKNADWEIYGGQCYIAENMFEGSVFTLEKILEKRISLQKGF